jgi:hypothetical protein
VATPPAPGEPAKDEGATRDAPLAAPFPEPVAEKYPNAALDDPSRSEMANVTMTDLRDVVLCSASLDRENSPFRGVSGAASTDELSEADFRGPKGRLIISSPQS